MLPKKKQWRKWSLPSKYSSMGLLVSLIAVLLSLIFYLFPLEQRLSDSSDVELGIVFLTQNNVRYYLVNNSNSLAQDILMSSGIVRLNSKDYSYVPIPVQSIGYINSGSRRGPWNFLDNYIVNNEKKFFGRILLECKGCKHKFHYSIYINYESPNSSFYAKVNLKDSDIFKLPTNHRYLEEYLNGIIPQSERVYF